jgi:hypothetical protein
MTVPKGFNHDAAVIGDLVCLDFATTAGASPTVDLLFWGNLHSNKKSPIRRIGLFRFRQADYSAAGTMVTTRRFFRPWLL